MSWEVVIPDEFERDFKKFFNKLDRLSRTRVTFEIDLLEKHGIDLGMPYSKKINSRIWELRTSGRQRVRILYHVCGTKIYLLNWFVKKSQKLPIRELRLAIRRLTIV